MTNWYELAKRERVESLLAMGFTPTWLEELLTEGDVTFERCMELTMTLEAVRRELFLIEAFHKNPACLVPLSADSVVKRLKEIILLGEEQ